MRPLYLGRARALAGADLGKCEVPSEDFTNHAVVLGMSGSGKTGFVTVTLEEALRARVPSLVIDIKGDLPNLLLAFPSFEAVHFNPWVEGSKSPRDARAPQEIAEALAAERAEGLGKWELGEAELAALREQTRFRVVTPGSSAGEPLHLLSALERHSERWKEDPETARGALSAAVSLVLRLLGRDPDPARSREHVLLSVLAERRLSRGESAELGALLKDVVEPPLENLGALPVDDFLSKAERKGLAAALNALLASPTFASWREGVTLDVGAWLTPESDGRTPCVIVSLAHLDDEERALVLGILLEELLSWVRTLPGSQHLRALVVFDEVYGFLPPHPANPPTKRPLVALLKQARAFGVGLVIATQNPMDLDYRALGNAGIWAIGRLQTDADRARVLEGLANSEHGVGVSELGELVKRLGRRWFLFRNARAQNDTHFLQARWAMSWMRGPMTRNEIKRARALHAPRDPET